jgi:hypothetical protein
MTESLPCQSPGQARDGWQKNDPSRFRQLLFNKSNAIFLSYIFMSWLFFMLLTRFQIQISIDEFQIEFESVNPPTAAGFGQMKVVTADKSSCVPVGWVRQIMESDAVAEHLGCVILEIDNVIAGLVVNRFERF